MQFHPAADIFPLMQGDEYEALKADIGAHGLLEPICLEAATRTIIDGRNRYRACCELGVEPRFEWWEGEDPIAYVLSENLHRRHLDESQRAMVGARAANMREGRPSETAQICAVSQSDAADMVNASRRSVQHAAKVLKSGTPELVKAVDAGKVAVSAAARLVDMPPGKATAVLEKIDTGAAKGMMDALRLVRRDAAREARPLEGKYGVIYADPPFDYRNSGLDNYGHAERHYDPMSIDELCRLPVAKIAEEDAVLFLWVPAPMLEEVFPVVHAWSFAYKTHFVWDKVKHNFGHYNSVRHELLFICTRGSCLPVPDVPELVDSVQTIKRSKRHSEKPEEFRQIIDTLYPHGNRIELFARKSAPAPGWKVWGNECDASQEAA